MVPRKWTSSQMPLFGPMHPCSNGNKRDILRLPWRGQLPAPADWRPAASLEDFLAQQRDHCIKAFGNLCTKMHDYAFTSVTLTDHPEYGFQHGLTNALDATGTPLKEKDAQEALKFLSTSGKDFELVLVETDFYEWVRNVAKVDTDKYNFGRTEYDVYTEAMSLLRPEPATSGTWEWMSACFQAVPEALRKGIHVVMLNQHRGHQLDLATGKFPTRQFTLAEIY
ncbi:unnamed protein product [Cladocopium goreaui]|uniref:Uncharacterized protein n=1 Tax=Cladocopium goreaui TaxID=2562237 RepID=A0A9P1GKI8_9DINO|nr:unnamed protein product [Cladocopium goreaui]